MQYILHDLIKLPLADRLIIIEEAITSIGARSKKEHLVEAVAIKKIAWKINVK